MRDGIHEGPQLTNEPIEPTVRPRALLLALALGLGLAAAPAVLAGVVDGPDTTDPLGMTAPGGVKVLPPEPVFLPQIAGEADPGLATLQYTPVHEGHGQCVGGMPPRMPTLMFCVDGCKVRNPGGCVFFNTEPGMGKDGKTPTCLCQFVCMPQLKMYW